MLQNDGEIDPEKILSKKCSSFWRKVNREIFFESKSFDIDEKVLFALFIVLTFWKRKKSLNPLDWIEQKSFQFFSLNFKKVYSINIVTGF